MTHSDNLLFSVVSAMDIAGTNNIEEELKDTASFYTDAAQYWSAIPATVDGVLGGFGFISHRDIQGSITFLKQLFKVILNHQYWYIFIYIS